MIKFFTLNKHTRFSIITTFFLLLGSTIHAAVPPNDSCGGAIPIVIGNGGFALGLFTSTNTDITSATLQTGETFAPSIIVAGLNKKSVWYKFSLPTNRSVRVSLLQPGSAIQAGNVGFTIYKTKNCLPGDADISTKLSPIETFGNTFHPCVDVGDYLVQVTSNNAANGPIYITIETAEPTPAEFDKPVDAYDFVDSKTFKTLIKDYFVQCQTIDNAAENCQPNGSFVNYTKSTWQTFTTPGYFDYLNFWLAIKPGNYGLPPVKIGYRLYEGDAKTTAVASLLPVGGCDSILTDLYSIGKKYYGCGMLKPNTKYSVQLLFHKDFNEEIRIAVEWNGSQLTNGPLPVSSLASPNKITTLNTSATTGGATNLLTDYFSCNSRHSQNNCPKSMPANGVLYNGYNYNLSSFFSFNLATTTSLFFNPTNNPCSGQLLMRLYKQTLTNNCADLDTANIIAVFHPYTYQSNPLSCLAPGDYVLQVMGIDSVAGINSLHISSLNNSPDNYMCRNMGLGSFFKFNLNARTEVAINKFALQAAGKFDKINANGLGVMQPLQRGITYTAIPDTMGCANTVLPDDDICKTVYNEIYTKASYREFVVADSFILQLPDYLSNSRTSKLYKGDANALVTAQNSFNFPQKITGLQPYSFCMYGYSSNAQNACIVPGTYTIANFDNRVGAESTTKFTIIQPRTKYALPSKAENMGDVWSKIDASYNMVMSDVDTFTCYDNPAIIDGVSPCTGVYSVLATKLIYRQFYLSKPAIINIFTSYNGYPFYKNFAGTLSLFAGKATDGLPTLKTMGTKWTCFTSAASLDQCDALPAGWYTVVSYGVGPTYSNPLPNNAYDVQYSDLGTENGIFIRLTIGCAAPQYNRPYKASVDTLTKKPYLIEWGPQTGHTAAYPVTSKKYTLNVENFNCTQDTAFIRQNMKSCDVTNVKVAFYVFKITQESYVQIDGIADGLWSSVYAFDVRSSDSTKLKTDEPLQTCTNKQGVMEFCKLQPGTYTIVFYAPVSYTCNVVSPTIYIDQVGVSRFDHAAKAYDFGAIKPDSTWYSGKSGDVNPLNSGRTASNDFFYCSTGAQEKDPADAVCYTAYNPFIYTAGNNVVLHPDNATAPNSSTIDRRNLWYTFTVNQPGNVSIRVDNKTPGKAHQYPYTVYKSDVDGSLPFSSVVAGGMVDSTLLDGLTFIKTNLGYICTGTREISIYNEPCSFKPTRYYILVENRNSIYYAGMHDMNPNSQVEVSILLDSVTALPPKFDHFSQANDMGLVNSGIKKGAVDNFTCATRDLPDPLNYNYVSNCNKTLWYKFTTTITGQIRYAAFFKNTNNYYYDHIQLFRQIKPNDSSVTGLQTMPHTTTYNNNGTWAQQCISPGTYYIILPGCNAVNEDVYPQIEIIPQAGDFCSSPMIASLTGAGSKVVPVTVDCHTIGTDYGEFNPTLTCPAGAITSNYKTSWYRLDITGTDTLDVTVYIDEKTNAGSTDIKYRMMTGTCGAMQEQSCVQDALTRNTYKCLAPGNSYYIQVFTPLTQAYSYPYQVTGDIDLNIAAVVHADTCLPSATCIGVANFTPQFDCTKDKNVTFTNFSTYGSSIQYDWDFGYNNQKSNAVSPQFFYPALTTSKTYTVKLVITNTLCGKKDSVTQTITIPARPAVNLGNDTVICNNGSTITLDATSHTGSTYYWSYNGSTQPTFTLGVTYTPIVEVTYNGCKARDTINVFINPIAKRALQTKALCAVTQVTLDAARGQGEQYQWSTGAVSSSITAAQPGYYWVDMYLRGCYVRDSFLVVSSSLKPLGNDTTLCQVQMPYKANATVSGASSYSWQDASGNANYTITKPGLYWVDINLSGCTFRDSLLIAVDSFKTVTGTSRICQGQTYKLPSGKIINTAGIYKDSLKNNRGCDSLITTLTLIVDTVKRLSTAVSICAGQTYTLPGGRIVNNAGNYLDTLKYKTGCDSLITTLNLSIATVSKINKNASICKGTSYTLPSGKSISLTGIYVDTIKAKAGCDSLITTVNLTVISPVVNNTTASICFGNSYSLPSGILVFTGGVYKDTIRYVNGCDSLIRNVTLTVNTKPVLGADKSVSICAGNSISLVSLYNTTGLSSTWTLNGVTITNPATVTIAGTYQLIGANANGCSDTALATITVNAKPDLGNDLSAVICPGNSVDLTTRFATSNLTSSWTISGVPVISPASVSASGVYQLIVQSGSGCSDTALFTITVAAKPLLGADKTISICPGFTADLTGLYNTTGFSTAFTIGGVAVTNPSAVNIAGNYMIVASNSAGCSDTAIVTIDINQKPNLGADRLVTICAGNTLNLATQYTTTGFSSNWTIGGITISNPSTSAAGIYQLVVANSTGCLDTAFLSLSVNPKPTLGADKSAALCPGNTIDLTGQFTTTGLNTNWTLGANTITNPVTISVAGNYRLIASNTFGCLDTAFFAVSISPKPILGADKQVLICAGNSVNLNSQFITTGLTTNWTLNGAAVTNPITITSAGIYRLEVTNTSGCKDTAFVTISIDPKPSLGIDQSLTVCAGTPVDLTSRFNTTNLSSIWTVGGLAVNNPQSVSSAGAYLLIAANSTGCRDTAIFNLQANPRPSLGADKNISACVGNTVDLTKEYVTTGLTATWTIGNTVVPNPASISIAGVYQLIVSNSFSCADTAKITLTINQNPIVAITNPSAVCTPSTVNLTAGAITSGSGSDLSFTYWKDVAASVSLTNATTATSGLYYIKGTNINGCFSIQSVTVVVYDLPVVSAGRDTTICDQSFAILRGSATSLSGGTVSYLWSPPVGLSNAAAATTTARLGATQNYTLTAKVDFGPCTLSATDNINVTMQPPVPAFAGNDTIAVVGIPQQLKATGGVNYLWSPAGPLNNTRISNPMAILQQDTRFIVQVTDIAGCVATDTMLIKVYNGTTYYIPNAFSPNGDGLNDVFRPIPAGIASTEWFRIFNRYGTLIFESSKWMDGWDGTYKGQKQPIGNYIYVIKGKSRDGKVIEMKGNVVLVK